METKYTFTNKPNFLDLLNTNILIFGNTGTGKSVLLHQIIKEIKENYPKSLLYLHDPKCVELVFEKKDSTRYGTDTKFTYSFIHELKRRSKLTKEQLENEKQIIYICDEINALENNALMKYYPISNKLKVIMIITSQLEDFYNNNKETCNCGTVIQLTHDDNNNHVVTIINQP